MMAAPRSLTCTSEKVGKTYFPLSAQTALKQVQCPTFAVSQCRLQRSASPTLSYGYGLEPVQLSQQAGALRGVKAINKLLGSPGRVERLHGLLQRVCAQVTPLDQHREGRLCGEAGRYEGCVVVAESGSGHPSPGSEGESGPQDSVQAGQHLWDGGRLEQCAGNLKDSSGQGQQ